MFLTESLTNEVSVEVAEEVAEKVSFLQASLPALQTFGIKLLFAVIIFFIGHKLIKIVRSIFFKTVSRMNVDVTAGHFFGSVLNALLHVFLVFFIASQLGFSTSTIIAVLGSATLALGLALQDSLAHFAGGLLILLMHPFKVGDYIICTAGEGTVQAIGLVYTTIITLDNRTISIPNGTLSSDNVTNCSAFPFRRVDLFVGIGYDDDIKTAKEVLRQVYSDNEYISDQHDINVYVSELGDSAVVLGGQGYTAVSNYLKAKWSLTEEIRLAFAKAGISIPYKQIDLHIEDHPSDNKKSAALLP